MGDTGHTSIHAVDVDAVTASLLPAIEERYSDLEWLEQPLEQLGTAIDDGAWERAAAELLAIVLRESSRNCPTRIGALTLSRWYTLEPGVSFPSELRGSAGDLFEPLAAAHPELRAALASSDRVAIPPDQVPAAIEWTRAAIERGLAAGWLHDPREASAILRILEEAAFEGLAYVEAPGVQVLGESPTGGVRDDDLITHPHELDFGVGESSDDAFRRDLRRCALIGGGPLGPARWWAERDVTEVPLPDRLDETTGQVFDSVELPDRVRSAVWSPDGTAILVVGADVIELRGHDVHRAPPLMARWAAAVDGRIVACRLAPATESPHELVDGAWRPCAGLPASSSALGDVVHDLLLWLGDAYQWRGDQWILARSLGLSRMGGHGTVAHGATDFHALGETGLVRVDAAGVHPIAPCAVAGSSLAWGPGGAVIVTEGPNRAGRNGFVYLPADGRIIEVTGAVCGLEEVQHLAYDPLLDALVASAQLPRRGGRSFIQWRALIA